MRKLDVLEGGRVGAIDSDEGVKEAHLIFIISKNHKELLKDILKSIVSTPNF